MMNDGMRERMTLTQIEEHQRKHGFRQPVLVTNKPPVIPPVESIPKRKSKGMNKTETRFSELLDEQKKCGLIAGYEFEGITVKLADGSRYTPDFAIMENRGTIWFVETKCEFIREAAMVRFKVAKSKWTQFKFELWQWKNSEWVHLL